MAQQEGGWPLGLQPLNLRVGLIRNREFSGSISLVTASSTSSSVSSSDLDTESTGSFFTEKSITLGNLIGITSIIEMSQRSVRGRRTENLEMKKNWRAKEWFSLCTKACASNCKSPINPQSLGHFLEVERRAAGLYRRRNSTPIVCENGEFDDIGQFVN